MPGSCRWAGCTQPIQEIHHVRHWAAGGRSDLDNLCGLCTGHHHLAHHPHWHIDGNAHDTITLTYLPTGRTHHSRPPRH